MSTFTVAGVSCNKGKVKVRFCSDMILRIKNLQKQGDTDILLIELPKSMNKVEACNFLLAHPSFEKYSFDIKEVLGKKNEQNSTQPVLKPVMVKPKVDPEIEELRELAEA